MQNKSKNSSSSSNNSNKRQFNIKKGESKVWKNLKPYRGDIKMSGSGKKTKYYVWDNLHDEIEVYNRNGVHLGSMKSTNGKMYKPPVPGRTIKL